MGLGSCTSRQSGRSSRVKRLNESISQKSYKSFLSFSSRRTPLPPLRIPKMSKPAFKRWLDARDAYLGHQFPFLRERPHSRRRPRRRRRPPGPTQIRPISIKSAEKSINDDDDGAISIFTLGSERLPEQNATAREPSRRKESLSKTTSRSEGSLRRSGILERIKSFVQSPARSLSCLSVRRRTPCRSPEKKTKTTIVHDHFDDKCVGTEISDFPSFRSPYPREDQAIQVDLVRPQIELHYEFDPSMVEGEKQVQRIRSVRSRVEFSDKTTETEFISIWPNVEKEEENEEEKDKRKKSNSDKATSPAPVESKVDSYITSTYRSKSMLNSPGAQPNPVSHSPTPSKNSSTSNRIIL